MEFPYVSGTNSSDIQRSFLRLLLHSFSEEEDVLCFMQLLQLYVPWEQLSSRSFLRTRCGYTLSFLLLGAFLATIKKPGVLHTVTILFGY